MSQPTPIISDCLQGSEEWDRLRRSKLTASEFKSVLGTSDFKVAYLTPEATALEGGFGRAKKQGEVFDQLVAAGPKGLTSSDVNASGLKGLIDKGLADTKIDGSGCSIKKVAALRKICYFLAQQDFSPAEMGEFTGSFATERGNYLEPAARIEFENQTGLDVREVGFAMHPDLNLVGASPDGLVSDDGGPAGSPMEIKCQLPQNHLWTLRENKLPNDYRAQVHGQMAICGASHGWFCAYCPPYPSVILKIPRSDYTDNLFKCLTEFQDIYVEEIAAFSGKEDS